MKDTNRLTQLLGAALLMSSASLFAHGNREHREATEYGSRTAEQKAFGIVGNPKKVSRTIVVEMTDAMRFIPDRITVTQDETVRFVVKITARCSTKW